MGAGRRESDWVVGAAPGLEGRVEDERDLASSDAGTDRSDTARGGERLCLRICISPRERMLSMSLLIQQLFSYYLF